jgi:periplasmic protein TonB
MLKRSRLFGMALVVLFAAKSVSAQDIFSAHDPGVTLPRVLKQVRAVYTPAARAAGIEGDVLLSAGVRADGSVDDVTVTTSLDAVNGLDEQAVKALKQWQFRPGTKDGKPVAVRIAVQMRFTLK